MLWASSTTASPLRSPVTCRCLGDPELGLLTEILEPARFDRVIQRLARIEDLVDQGRPVFSLRLNKFVDVDDDPEEWLRSFAESFRSAQVAAVIVKDTAHKELVAPPEFLEQLKTTATA